MIFRWSESGRREGGCVRWSEFDQKVSKRRVWGDHKVFEREGLWLQQFLVVNWEDLCSRITTCLTKSSTERLWSKTQATLYKTLDTSQLLRHTFELFPGSYGNAKSFSSKRFVWMARTWSYSVSVFSCRTRLSCSVSVFGFPIRLIQLSVVVNVAEETRPLFINTVRGSLTGMPISCKANWR